MLSERLAIFWVPELCFGISGSHLFSICITTVLKVLGWRVYFHSLTVFSIMFVV
nr:hypothetical protein Iba_chr13cCG15950 [Ipomoea batatas]